MKDKKNLDDLILCSKSFGNFVFKTFNSYLCGKFWKTEIIVQNLRFGFPKYQKKITVRMPNSALYLFYIFSLNDLAIFLEIYQNLFGIVWRITFFRNVCIAWLTFKRCAILFQIKVSLKIFQYISMLNFEKLVKNCCFCNLIGDLSIVSWYNLKN